MKFKNLIIPFLCLSIVSCSPSEMDKDTLDNALKQLQSEISIKGTIKIDGGYYKNKTIKTTTYASYEVGVRRYYTKIEVNDISMQYENIFEGLNGESMSYLLNNEGHIDDVAYLSQDTVNYIPFDEYVVSPFNNINVNDVEIESHDKFTYTLEDKNQLIYTLIHMDFGSTNKIEVTLNDDRSVKQFKFIGTIDQDDASYNVDATFVSVNISDINMPGIASCLNPNTYPQDDLNKINQMLTILNGGNYTLDIDISVNDVKDKTHVEASNDGLLIKKGDNTKVFAQYEYGLYPVDIDVENNLYIRKGENAISATVRDYLTKVNMTPYLFRPLGNNVYDILGGFDFVNGYMYYLRYFDPALPFIGFNYQILDISQAYVTLNVDENNVIQDISIHYEAIKKDEGGSYHPAVIETKVSNIGTTTFPYEKQEELTFGKYPQSYVGHSVNEQLKVVLNNVTPNENGYYSYNNNEYVKVEANPAGVDYVFSDGTIVSAGETYYFNVKPIEWDILDENNEGFLLFSKYILDAHEFSATLSNNYASSTIRTFLNDEFLNKAFSEEERDRILLTTVDNSSASTMDEDHPYICEDTDDYVYPLSYKDLTSFEFKKENTIDEARAGIVSDYFKAIGGYVLDNERSDYWTRTPYNYNSSSVMAIIDNGMFRATSPTLSDTGVRPSIRISF